MLKLCRVNIERSEEVLANIERYKDIVVKELAPQAVIIPVILSGGAGTRLWPVSRQGRPKPFMKLADGESLLLKTYRRAAAVVESAQFSSDSEALKEHGRP